MCVLRFYQLFPGRQVYNLRVKEAAVIVNIYRNAVYYLLEVIYFCLRLLGIDPSGRMCYDAENTYTTAIPGDIAPAPRGDNYIDIQDYNALIACLQRDKSCTNPSLADLNNNGMVNQQDLDILISNFGKNGLGFTIPQFTCFTDRCVQKIPAKTSNSAAQMHQANSKVIFLPIDKL